MHIWLTLFPVDMSFASNVVLAPLHDTQSLSAFDPTSCLTSQSSVCTAAHPSQTLLLPVCAFAPAVLCVCHTRLPLSLCKTPIHLSKTICISPLLWSLLWLFPSSLELNLSIPYAYLHDYTYLLNTAQPSEAPEAALCMWGGTLMCLGGAVWIRWYMLEHPTEAMYQVTSPTPVFIVIEDDICMAPLSPLLRSH